MRTAAERMREMRGRRRTDGMREVRLYLPDVRSPAVRARIEDAVGRLNERFEDEALRFIEAVAEFDELDPSQR